MTDFNLSKSELLADRQRSVLGELADSALYAGLQAPISGVVQIVDKTTGSNMLPAVQFMDAPQHAEFGTSKWYAQQFGSVAGMAVPFLLMHKAVGATGNGLLGRIENTTANQGLLARRMIGESAVTGAVFEGVFRPVAAGEGDFLAARLRHATVGGATFASMSASVIGLKSLAFAERGASGAAVRSDIGAAVLAGIPAGVVNAELTSLTNGRGLATEEELAQSVYAFSVLGGTMALGKRALGTTHSERSLAEQMKAESSQAIAQGHPDLLTRAADGISNSLNTLENALGGPRMQFAFAGAEFASCNASQGPRANMMAMTINEAAGGGNLPKRSGVYSVRATPPRPSSTEVSHGRAVENSSEVQPAATVPKEAAVPGELPTVAAEPTACTRDIKIPMYPYGTYATLTEWTNGRKLLEMKSGFARRGIIEPDGTKILEYENGALRTERPDGTLVIRQESGLLFTNNPSGVREIVYPDGSRVSGILRPIHDGLRVTEYTDLMNIVENQHGIIQSVELPGVKPLTSYLGGPPFGAMRINRVPMWMDGNGEMRFEGLPSSPLPNNGRWDFCFEVELFLKRGSPPFQRGASRSLTQQQDRQDTPLVPRPVPPVHCSPVSRITRRMF